MTPAQRARREAEEELQQRAWADKPGGRLEMNDEPEHTDVVVNGPAMVEIDAETIAQIIFDHCHTSEARAAKAANLMMIDYLAQAVSKPQ